MIHLGAALGLATIGVIAAAPAIGWLGRFGAAVLSVPLGVSLFVVSGALLAWLGLFSVLAALTLSTATAGVIAFVVIRHQDSSIDMTGLRDTAVLALGGAAAVAVVALVVPAARLTNDSFGYLISASALDATGGLDAISNLRLVKQQLAVTITQTPGWVGQDGYTPVMAPLFGVATLASLGWVTTRHLSRSGLSIRWQATVLGAAGLLLLTTNRFVFNLTYVNGHMLVALLLLAATGIMWLGLVEGDTRHVYLAGIVLAALSITRADTLILIAVFVVPYLTEEDTSLAERLTATLPITVVAGVWYGLVLPPHAPGSGISEVALYGNALIAVGLSVTAVLGSFQRAGRLVRWSPWMMLIGIGVLLVVFAVDQPGRLISSINALAVNAAFWGFWGFFWYVVPPLVAASLLAGGVPRDRIWGFGITGFALTLPLIAYLRDGAFRVGSGDSANRMLLHIVPVLIAYLVLSVGRAAREVERDTIDDVTADTT